MIRIKITAMLCLAVLVLFDIGDSLEVGDVCLSSDKCGKNMVCLDNRCTCDPNVEMVPTFSSGYTQKGVLCLEREICDYTMDPPKKCRFGSCNLELGEKRGVCSCSPSTSTMRVISPYENETCRPYREKFFNEACGPAVPMCTEKKGLICRSGRCLCKVGQIYNFKAKECASVEPYLERYNLTEYKARWGDYCVDDDDCLEILECALNKTCECPYDCAGYIKEHNSCYCGDREYPVGPVVVGVFVGFLILIFWCYQIDKLCKRFQRNRTLVPQDDPMEGNEDTEDGETEASPTRTVTDDSLPDYDSVMAADNQPETTAPPLATIADDNDTVLLAENDEDQQNRENEFSNVYRRRNFKDPQPMKM